MEQITKLRGDVQDLTIEVGKLRSAFGRRTAALAVVGVAFILAAVLALHVQAGNDRRIVENNRRWCPLVSVLIPQPGDPPATSARGRLVADRAAQMFTQFQCPPSNGAS